ncbi:hypothetical protein ACIF8W_29725 [Streptomyces sp. NPDC085639]
MSVKALAARFPEGEVRIGNALRELEKHGFLEGGASGWRPDRW